jgi:hypothetical protein
LHFLENIRQYNSILAFGSVRTSFDRLDCDYAKNRKPFIYKCHGNMYFHFPSIFRKNDQVKHETAQYYVMDSNIAHQQRLENWKNENGSINDHLLCDLEKMILEVNPFSRLLKNNRKMLKSQLESIPNECRLWLKRASLNLTGDVAIGKQTQLSPDIVGGEIAVVFPDANGLPPKGIKIAIYPKSNSRQFINIRDPNADPICFPLLFPYGEAGKYFYPKLSTNLYLNFFNLKAMMKIYYTQK